MTWLKRAKEILAKQRAEQEAREGTRRLVEEKKLEEQKRQEELRQEKLGQLKVEWERLEIDRILEDIKAMVFLDVISGLSEINAGEDFFDDKFRLMRKIYEHVTDVYGPTESDPSGYRCSGKKTVFVIRLYEGCVKFNDETVSLDNIPDAATLREKIDQYLAEKLEKGERK